MLIGLEKTILKRNFISFKNKNKNDIWSFHKIDDVLSQINLRYNGDTYKFSFPINDIHYTTTFTDKKNLMDYINFIIHSHKF